MGFSHSVGYCNSNATRDVPQFTWLLKAIVVNQAPKKRAAQTSAQATGHSTIPTTASNRIQGNSGQANRATASDPKQDVDSIREEIRASGMRATLARIQTLVLLRQSASPLTHADVADQLDHWGIDKATAFRNLNDLADAGLLRRNELGDHVWRFEAVDPSGADDNGHPHFVCVDCGVVTCMDTVRLTAGSLRKSETVGEVTEILLRGHCNACR